MLGLTMDYQLTIPAIMRRAETLSKDVEIVSRRSDRSIHRYRYHRHLEAYFAVPSIGAVLHTLNLRLHPNDLEFIGNHAADRFLIVDHTLLPLFERFRSNLNVEAVIIMSDDGGVPEYAIDYDQLIASGDAERFVYPDLGPVLRSACGGISDAPRCRREV